MRLAVPLSCSTRPGPAAARLAPCGRPRTRRCRGRPRRADRRRDTRGLLARPRPRGAGRREAVRRALSAHGISLVTHGGSSSCPPTRSRPRAANPSASSRRSSRLGACVEARVGPAGPRACAGACRVALERAAAEHRGHRRRRAARSRRYLGAGRSWSAPAPRDLHARAARRLRYRPRPPGPAGHVAALTALRVREVSAMRWRPKR